MANKKLKVGGGELKLPAKKDKTAAKPKWHANIGGKKGGEKIVAPEPAVETLTVTENETPIQDAPTLPTEPAETSVEATSSEATSLTTNIPDETVARPDVATPVEQIVPESASTEEPASNPRKLKVQADLKPKKLSMIAAALQVLQDRKVPMTCPELIDVMTTEGLWTSPGGKTPANTLYAAISRDIKDNGSATAFKKAERGKFEAKILLSQ